MTGKTGSVRRSAPKAAKMPGPATLSGACLCGAIAIETDFPVFWAWHDHTEAARRAHGAAYATYVGCWKSKVRIIRGERKISTFEDLQRRHVRSFCSVCGSPVMLARGRSSKMVDIPRALFAGRTGRDAKYHVGIEEVQDWIYVGTPVGPLKGYPGVTVERTARKPRTKGGLFDPKITRPGRRTVAIEEH